MLAAPIAHGRGFTAADRGAEPPVAVLNRRVALELFETGNAVGRTIRLGDNVLAVIGVAEGVQHFGLDQEIERDVYVLYDRFGGGLPMLHVGIRSSAGTEALAAGLREAVWSLEPDLPIEEIVTMPQRVSTSLAIPRFLSGLLGIFGVVAVLLASGGIYGSMLYSVGQRQHEMGIRMALGAGSGNVVRLILGHGVVLTAVGLGFGIAGAISLSWLLESLVWGIETTDLPTFAAATVLLAAAALAACFVPAWKAARANPLQTLRAE
jgi:putative ABC transport system permease protein